MKTSWTVFQRQNVPRLLASTLNYALQTTQVLLIRSNNNNNNHYTISNSILTTTSTTITISSNRCNTRTVMDFNTNNSNSIVTTGSSARRQPPLSASITISNTTRTLTAASSPCTTQWREIQAITFPGCSLRRLLRKVKASRAASVTRQGASPSAAPTSSLRRRRKHGNCYSGRLPATERGIWYDKIVIIISFILMKPTISEVNLSKLAGTDIIYSCMFSYRYNSRYEALFEFWRWRKYIQSTFLIRPHFVTPFHPILRLFSYLLPNVIRNEMWIWSVHCFH